MRKLLIIPLIFIIPYSCVPQIETEQSDKKENQTYTRISNSNSWGFINQDKDSVIPLGKYKFLNPIDEEGMIFAQLASGKYGFINIEQDTLISFKYDDLGVFTQGLAPAKFKGKYGYIDRQGQVVIPFKYETETYFYDSGLAIAKRDGNFGFIDKAGNEVIPIAFEKVDQSMTDTIVLVSKGDKWAFYLNNGERKTDFKYDEIVQTFIKVGERTKSSIFGNGLALVKKDDQKAYINTSFEEIVPFGTYDVAETFQNNLAIVAKKGKFGIIDTSGKVVLPLEYDFIEHPSEYSNASDLFAVKQDNRFQLLDKDANVITDLNIIEFEWDSYKSDETYHRYFILTNTTGMVGTVSENGAPLIPAFYQEIKPFDGKAVTFAKKEGTYGLIDYKGENIIPFEYEDVFSQKFFDYYIVKKSGKYGMVDKSGKQVFPFLYQSITPVFYDLNNRFIVEKNGLFGVIDIDEEVIIPIEFQEISNWVEYGPEEHFITKNRKEGLISRDGKIVIPPQYDKIWVDNSQLIKVKKNGMYGTIDWDNKVVHPIKYEMILWEWPYLNPLDTIYLKEKNGNYFSTDIDGKVLNRNVAKEVIDEKFGYLLSNE